jgi:hypothetical protein
VSNSDKHDSIPANCKVCGTRVTPDVRHAGKTVECPDCFSPIAIPSLEQHAQNEGIKKKEEVRQPEDVGTYGLRSTPQTATPAVSNRGERDGETTQAVSNPGARDGETKHDDSDDDIFKDKPASSLVAAVQPDSAEPSDSERVKKKKKRRKSAATAESNPSEAAEQTAGISALEALAEVKRHEIPDPPKNLFFSNVFEFPWSTTSAMVRWGILTFAFLLTLLMGAFLLYLRAELGGAAMIPIAFMALAQFALFAWACAYAGAYATSILQDTSAGNDEVYSWPEGGMTDCFGSLFTLMIPFFFAGFMAYLITLPLSIATGSLIPYIFIVHSLLIPIVTLSAMDAESIWFPASKLVAQTFKTVAKSWLFVTVLLNLLLVVTGFIAYWAVEFDPFLAAAINAPLFASTVFIYSRLLGRMAFTIGQNAPDEEDDHSDDSENE